MTVFRPYNHTPPESSEHVIDVRTNTFILDYPRPPKGLSANDRVHWSVRHGATQDIRLEVMAKTRALKLGAAEKVRIDVVWIVADRRRRDSDNLAPFLKAIYDGIGADKGVSARLVDDDDPTRMEKPAATIRYVAGMRPHFEVTIIVVDPMTEEVAA